MYYGRTVMRFSTGTKLNNSMQRLWCTSYKGFKQLVEENHWDKYVPDSTAIISINYTLINEDECHLCSGDNVLNLDFDDIDPVGIGLDANTESCKIGTATLHIFTDQMAAHAIDFIEKHKSRNFYIHCSAGFSRSQAFVRYIQTVYDDIDLVTNPDNPCMYPNGHVVTTLMRNWRKKYYANFFE